MNKILVSIYVLALEESYDILIPINLNMKEAIDLIQETLIELSEGAYQKKEAVLLYTEDGLVINTNNTVKFSGLTNGCKVLLK